MRFVTAMAVAVLAAGVAAIDATPKVAEAASDLRQNMQDMAEVRAQMRRDLDAHVRDMAGVRADMERERARVLLEMMTRVPQ